MKKFFAIALIAASFVACNDEKKAEETTTTVDSPKVETPAPAVVDTTAPKMDTTAPAAAPAAADTTKH